MAYESLETLLRLLCTGSGLHICIHDVSGLLEQSALALPFSYKMHASGFCDAAKETAAGLDLCMRCKARSNQKAVRFGTWFDGFCAYGLYELVHPVTIGGAVRCIIYIGNIIADRDRTVEMIHRATRITKVDPERVTARIPAAQPFVSQPHYRAMARLIDGHIRLLYQHAETQTLSGCHWAVKNIRHDIETHFAGELSLKREAQLYFLNEKYVGRIFKRETGCTFHQYLNRIRLRHAARQLRESERTVLDISLECGFQNVTYFNRLFKREFGMAPSAYRRE